MSLGQMTLELLYRCTLSRKTLGNTTFSLASNSRMTIRMREFKLMTLSNKCLTYFNQLFTLMLSAVKLSVVVSSVVAPKKKREKGKL